MDPSEVHEIKKDQSGRWRMPNDTDAHRQSNQRGYDSQNNSIQHGLDSKVSPYPPTPSSQMAPQMSLIHHDDQAVGGRHELPDIDDLVREISAGRTEMELDAMWKATIGECILRPVEEMSKDVLDLVMKGYNNAQVTSAFALQELISTRMKYFDLQKEYESFKGARNSVDPNRQFQTPIGGSKSMMDDDLLQKSNKEKTRLAFQKQSKEFEMQTKSLASLRQELVEQREQFEKRNYNLKEYIKVKLTGEEIDDIKLQSVEQGIWDASTMQDKRAHMEEISKKFLTTRALDDEREKNRELRKQVDEMTRQFKAMDESISAYCDSNIQNQIRTALPGTRPPIPRGGIARASHSNPPPMKPDVPRNSAERSRSQIESAPRSGTVASMKNKLMRNSHQPNASGMSRPDRSPSDFGDSNEGTDAYDYDERPADSEPPRRRDFENTPSRLNARDPTSTSVEKGHVSRIASRLETSAFD